MAVSRLSGSKPLLRRWKLGKGDYQSITFTRKDSDVARLEDLKRKIIAFEEPFSSSGYFFPKIALIEKGLRLVLKMRPSDAVKADEVGYVFSHGDSNTMLLVLNRVVAVGAIDDQKYRTLAKNLDSLKVLHETVSFSRQVVSCRADLPAKLVAKVKEIFLNMNQTDDGRKVLETFENTTKFDEIPARDVDLVAGLRKHVHDEHKLQR